MISSLRGTVVACTTGDCVLEVAGVGYSIQITPDHAVKLGVGEQALIHTALIVREDSLSLFGFETTVHRELFDLLRSVPNVGPKSAMAVIAAVSPAKIVAAVSSEDEATFKAAPGIGAKTAKLILVHLSGKLDGLGIEAVEQAAPSASDDVVAALKELGWAEAVAMATVESLVTAGAAQDDVSGLLKAALTSLGKNRSVRG